MPLIRIRPWASSRSSPVKPLPLGAALTVVGAAHLPVEVKTLVARRKANKPMGRDEVMIVFMVEIFEGNGLMAPECSWAVVWAYKFRLRIRVVDLLELYISEIEWRTQFALQWITGNCLG